MKKKKNKFLIAGGCSFTDAENIHLNGDLIEFPAWPELLASKLNYDYVNVGKRGCSNQRILENIMIEAAKRKPDIICVLWTGFDRFSIYSADHCPVFNLYSDRFKSHNNPEAYRQFCKSMLEIDDGISAHQNLMRIYLLQEYCKNNSIEFIFYQGINPYEGLTNKKLFDEEIIKNKKFAFEGSFYKDIIKSPFFELLDEKNFIDFPFHQNLGGSCFLEDYLLDEESPYKISKEDAHPGKLGHEKLAEIFYNKFNDLK